VRVWILVAVALSPLNRAYSQSEVRETTPDSSAPAAAPSMELGLVGGGTSRLKTVKLKRACEYDDDLHCVKALRVLFRPLDTLFGGAVALAHLQLVDADTGLPVKMLPPPKQTFHWKADLHKATRHYDIPWKRAHPPLTQVKERLFRIVVEGFDEVTTPRFKFID